METSSESYYIQFWAKKRKNEKRPQILLQALRELSQKRIKPEAQPLAEVIDEHGAESNMALGPLPTSLHQETISATKRGPVHDCPNQSTELQGA